MLYDKEIDYRARDLAAKHEGRTFRNGTNEKLTMVDC